MYKVTLKMGWDFIIKEDDKEIAIKKMKNYINSLVSKDGYTTMALKALENIKTEEFSMESYNGFIVV